MYIPIILGTAREGRRSERVAKFVLAEAQKRNEFETEILDVRDFIVESRTARLGKETNDKKAQKWSESMTRADGLIVVTPEYDHGYPGELKMMLDMLYDEYNRKPIGFCGVSAGTLGGPRAVEQLRLVAIEFQMVPIREAVYFPHAGSLLDEEGNINDESYIGRMDFFFQELVWYTKALQQARKQ